MRKNQKLASIVTELVEGINEINKAAQLTLQALSFRQTAMSVKIEELCRQNNCVQNVFWKTTAEQEPQTFPIQFCTVISSGKPLPQINSVFFDGQTPTEEAPHFIIYFEDKKIKPMKVNKDNQFVTCIPYQCFDSKLQPKNFAKAMGAQASSQLPVSEAFGDFAHAYRSPRTKTVRVAQKRSDFKGKA